MSGVLLRVWDGVGYLVLMMGIGLGLFALGGGVVPDIILSFLQLTGATVGLVAVLGLGEWNGVVGRVWQRLFNSTRAGQRARKIFEQHLYLFVGFEVLVGMNLVIRSGGLA